MRFAQAMFLKTLKNFEKNFGYTPSYQDLMIVTGYKSKQSIVRMMHFLLDNGYIKAELNSRGYIKMDTLKFVDF